MNPSRGTLRQVLSNFPLPGEMNLSTRLLFFATDGQAGVPFLSLTRGLHIYKKAAFPMNLRHVLYGELLDGYGMLILRCSFCKRFKTPIEFDLEMEFNLQILLRVGPIDYNQKYKKRV